MEKATKKAPQSLEQSIEKLRLFNEKVDVLQRRTFIRQVVTGSCNLHWEAGNLNIDKRGPDEEAVHAFMTTLRMFVQERDGISVSAIAGIYETLPVEETVKAKVRDTKNQMNAFRDMPMNPVYNNEPLTNWQFFEIFMYGGIAHANDGKWQRYRTWMDDPLASLMQHHFEHISAILVAFIFSLYQVNTQTIGALESLPN